jgi:hypothetical protein
LSYSSGCVYDILRGTTNKKLQSLSFSFSSSSIRTHTSTHEIKCNLATWVRNIFLSCFRNTFFQKHNQVVNTTHTVWEWLTHNLLLFERIIIWKSRIDLLNWWCYKLRSIFMILIHLVRDGMGLIWISTFTVCIIITLPLLCDDIFRYMYFYNFSYLFFLYIRMKEEGKRWSKNTQSELIYK